MFYKYYIIIILLLFTYCSNTKNDFKEIHIDFIINDDKINHFNRFVFLPDKKVVFILFFNGDANYDPSIQETSTEEVDFVSNQSLQNKLNYFDQITEKKSDYFIRFNKNNFIKFINFIEGIRFFIPDKLLLNNSDFIHYDGEQLYFGEKLYEYIFMMENYDKDSYAIISQNRHFRYETFILNFIYQLQEKKHILQKENQRNYILKFLETNLKPIEIQYFFESLLEYDFILIEFPLISKKNIKTKETLLFLNLEKSKMIYQQTLTNLINQKEEEETPITIEILNASLVNRLGNRVKSIIDSKLYKVLSVDNYLKELNNTYLISNHGNSFQLKKLKKLLHIQEKNVYFIRRIKDVEFSYILGTDFNIKTLIKQ